MATGSAAAPTMLGWREHIDLPALDLHRIKAKIDTGARTSSLHAVDVEVEGPRARFRIPLDEEAINDESWVEADLVEYREVKSSNGQAERRPVIETSVRLGHLTFTTLFTLTSRDDMGFPVLVGRQTLRRRFVVDPNASFLTTKK